MSVRARERERERERDRDREKGGRRELGNNKMKVKWAQISCKLYTCAFTNPIIIIIINSIISSPHCCTQLVKPFTTKSKQGSTFYKTYITNTMIILITLNSDSHALHMCRSICAWVRACGTIVTNPVTTILCTCAHIYMHMSACIAQCGHLYRTHVHTYALFTYFLFWPLIYSRHTRVKTTHPQSVKRYKEGGRGAGETKLMWNYIYVCPHVPAYNTCRASWAN